MLDYPPSKSFNFDEIYLSPPIIKETQHPVSLQNRGHDVSIFVVRFVKTGVRLNFYAKGLTF